MYILFRLHLSRRRASDLGNENWTHDPRLELDSIVRIYNLLRLLNTLFNRVFGESAWMSSLLFLIVNIFPMNVYSIIKLRSQLDFISYLYSVLAIPCLVVCSASLYAPMEALQISSTQISERSQVQTIIARLRRNSNSLVENKTEIQREIRYVSFILRSCYPIRCKLYSFGFVDKEAKVTFIKLAIDITIYFLLTF